MSQQVPVKDPVLPVQFPDPELYERLRQHSFETRKPMAVIVRTAVKAFLDKK